MYEKHWARGEFRDLFDDRSPDWPDTPVAEKVIDLRAFESAGLPVAELIDNYRETCGAVKTVAAVSSNVSRPPCGRTTMRSTPRLCQRMFGKRLGSSNRDPGEPVRTHPSGAARFRGPFGTQGLLAGRYTIFG